MKKGKRWRECEKNRRINIEKKTESKKKDKMKRKKDRITVTGAV